MKTRSAIPQGLFLSFILFVAAVCVHAQDDTATREITSLDFQNQRQKPVSGSAKITVPKNATPQQKKNIAVLTNKRRKYALVKRIPTPTTNVARINKNPTNSNKTVIKSEQIGVTFWRLRPIAGDD